MKIFNIYKYIIITTIFGATISSFALATRFVEYDDAQGFVIHSLFNDPNQRLQLLSDTFSTFNQNTTRLVSEKALKFSLDVNTDNSDEVFTINSGANNLVLITKESNLTFKRDVVINADRVDFINGPSLVFDSGRVQFMNLDGVVGGIVKDLLISNSPSDRTLVPSQGVYAKNNVWAATYSSAGVAPTSSYMLNINGSVNTDTSVCISGNCWTSLTPTDIFNNKAKYSITFSRTIDDVLEFGANNEVLASGYKYYDISPPSHTHVTGDLGAIIVNSDINEDAGIKRTKLAVCSKAAKNLYQINSLRDLNPSNCPAGSDGRKLDADTEGGVDACLTFSTLDVCID